jgi:hypothetical protein
MMTRLSYWIGMENQVGVLGSVRSGLGEAKRSINKTIY